MPATRAVLCRLFANEWHVQSSTLSFIALLIPWSFSESGFLDFKAFFDWSSLNLFRFHRRNSIFVSGLYKAASPETSPGLNFDHSIPFDCSVQFLQSTKSTTDMPKTRNAAKKVSKKKSTAASKTATVTAKVAAVSETPSLADPSAEEIRSRAPRTGAPKRAKRSASPATYVREYSFR